jgi:DNA-binding MarR family transcriptional regulator
LATVAAMPNRPDYHHFDHVVIAWKREFPDAALDHFLLCAAMMRIGQMLEQDLLQTASRLFDIGGAELGLLMALRRLGPPYAARPRTLIPLLLITSGAVTKQIDRLEKKGLVSRAQDTATRNGQIVTLTEDGLALTERAVRHLAARSIGCQAAETLPREVIAKGDVFVRAMLDAMSKLDDGTPPARG